ncbi:MAG: cobalamin biosynthesis protein CobD [Dehalococcoidia bacterium]|nr:cobalamin biosynthesis protein CobD [Dehalococcoidia bacterium]
MRRPLALLAGVALDAAFGDPPNAAHPVAWFGGAAAFLDAHAPRTRPSGVCVTAALIGGTAALAAVLDRRGRWLVPPLVAWTVTSRRSLFAHATEIADALDADDLDEARRLLAWHLVSRDTSTLTASEVAGATVESVAENLSDGVVAPWCWFVLGGAPAAAAYRALNTLDGMWGYRTPRYAEFGWAAARGDDIANLLPARMTAAAVVVASGARWSSALRTWGRDRGQTDSPNAGHPMSAMAGALGVTLRKRGHYALNEGVREPGADDIRAAVRLADRAAWVALGALFLAGMRR